MKKLFLDIDGVLITAKQKKLPEHLFEFIEFITTHFDCYWLTTHCNGDSATAIDYLSEYLNQKVLRQLNMVKPTNWITLKTEAIDLTSDFYWLDDAPLRAEVDFLKLKGLENNLIIVNLLNQNELKRIIGRLEPGFDLPKDS